jgi:hypothetical protein
VTQLPRRFHLQRDTDITGVSGTGRVADGVLWPDGSVAIRWRGDRPSTVHWDRIADAEHVHGHHGATRIEWDDETVHTGGNAEAAAGSGRLQPISPLYILGVGAEGEDAQRDARRTVLRLLLARADRGALGPDEGGLMRQHVEAEIRDTDTARAVAAGNKRHVQVMYEKLEQANTAARRALEQRQEMAEERYVIQGQRDTADRIRAEAQRDRDQHAAVLAEVLATFVHKVPGLRLACLRSGPVDVVTLDKWRSVVAPTVERPWWVTVAEVRAELGEAQAAIERVRNYLAELEGAGWSQSAIARRIRAALDGTEQPTRGNRLCHVTDPKSLRECARPFQHPGVHADGDYQWPEQPTPEA